MNVHLIDRATAEGQAGEKVIDRLLVAAEEEAGKGLWMLLHLTNRGIHVLIGKDWEKRPKDLVLHDWIVPSDRIKDGWVDVPRLAVGGTTGNHLARIDQGRKPVNRLRTDDARVIGIVLRIGAVQLDHGLLAFSNELLDDRFMNVSVSGRSTPLASPRQRAPYNFLGCVRDIGCRVDKCRILSAELEKDGGQVLCSSLHDDLANLDAPGEEDEVKRQLEKFCNLFFASRDRGNRPRIEVFRYEIQQELTCGGQTLGEFEDAWISCRNNLDRRVEEQRQWSIERADYQSDAIRFSIDLGGMPTFPKGLRNNYIYRLHPLFQICFRESRGSYRSHDLEYFFLTGSLEVAAHRILQCLGVLVAQVLQACQLVNAPLVRFGRVRIEVRLLQIKKIPKLIHCLVRFPR